MNTFLFEVTNQNSVTKIVQVVAENKEAAEAKAKYLSVSFKDNADFISYEWDKPPKKIRQA